MTISTMQPRLSTGISSCDEILNGGLVPHRSYLLASSPRSGKTILSLKWLRDRLVGGERCVHITLCEPAAEIGRNVANFGWNLHDVELVDLSVVTQAPNERINEYHMFPHSEVEGAPVWQAIYGAVQNSKPQRLVIDSVTQLHYLASDNYQFRRNILGLVNLLNGAGCIFIFALVLSEMERDTTVALAVDAVIQLESGISAGLGIRIRGIQIDKLRGSDFMPGRHPMRIKANGISVFPHRIEHTGTVLPGERAISSGIAQFDRLLGDGLESDTTPLLTGPTGNGKRTLGTQFLVQYAESRHAILFTFEEPASFIAPRSRNIGAPIDAAVENNKRTMVTIDSLRGYQLAQEEFGKPQAHIQNLANNLSRQNVTLLLTNEVEYIISTSLKAIDLGVSHRADNMVLLRYAEIACRLIKIVGCLKKRIGDFESKLRKLKVGPFGIQISEKLPHLQGALTGLPATSYD